MLRLRKIVVFLAFLIACFGITAPAHANGNDPLPLINPTEGRIKIGESITFTSLVSGGTPPYSYHWYLNETIVSDAISDTWEFAPISSQPIGNYTVYLIVEDNLMRSGQSNSAIVTVAPALTVQISPLSASILVGEPIALAGTNVAGGYPPYSYQWYLDGKQVLGMTLDNWTFIPTAIGTYYVHLKVTDTTNNTALSETARIIAQSIPVGGYSVSPQKDTRARQEMVIYMLAIFLGTILGLKKRSAR